MGKNKLSIIIIGTILLLNSCATSMTPVEISGTLPGLTESKFMSQIEGEEAMKSNKCKLLIKGRSYTAPIGLTTKNDLKNAARGIDEWVKLDNGNSYVLTNYQWVTVDHMGSTQLQVEFDTMLCE